MENKLRKESNSKARPSNDLFEKQYSELKQRYEVCERKTISITQQNQSLLKWIHRIQNLQNELSILRDDQVATESTLQSRGKNLNNQQQQQYERYFSKSN